MDAELLLAHALGCERSELFARDDEPVGDAHALRFEGLVDERARGVPVAYLTGEAWFYGRRFEITRDVLVPRPETEHVVEAVLADLLARKAANLRIADIGTGSGAIAVSLACELPEILVLGTDLSQSALVVARRNARAHGIEERCAFLCGDLLEPLIGSVPLDCIVANLPYVPTAEIPKPPNPVAFEPALAVDGGADGLVHYRRLLTQVPSVAATNATIFLEAAPPTIEPLAALVEHLLPKAHIEIREDYSGLERFLYVALLERSGRSQG
jgi:release factor glutamine methyltransferase